MKIYLKGFKSIKTGQFVSLGRKLTFLVGPNSAGKSAVMVALDKLKGKTPSFDLDETLVHRNPNNHNQISAIHAVGAEWKNKNENLSFYAGYSSEDLFYRHAHAEDFLPLHTNDDSCTTDDFNNGAARFFTSQCVDGVVILTTGGTTKPIIEQVNSKDRLENAWSQILFFTGSESVIIDFNSLDNSLSQKFHDALHWLVSTLKTLPLHDVDGKDLVGYKESTRERVISDRIKKNKGILDRIDLFSSLIKKKILKWNTNDVRWICSMFDGKDRQRAYNIFERHDAIIKRYKKSIDVKFQNSYPGSAFDVSLVSAGRTLPTPTDLDSKVNFNANEGVFHELMKTQIAKEWEENCGIKIAPSYSENKDGPSLLDLINKALSENLFIDNAYHLHVESKMIVSQDDWISQEFDQYEPPEFMGKLFLRDSHGRNLRFEDVGSGIGYVLPVLIESLSAANQKKIVFLQQPELHLHPALQASLTDVLIEASSNKRIVAETHSEHMILRALKRVRQTTNGTLKDPELKLKSDDIAVNYFEPLPDGSTRVHILRVSEDGDFLDRWPNGFFAERDQELFDE